MKRTLIILTLLTVMMMTAGQAWAQSQKTAYAVLSDNNDGTKTLTFKYEVFTLDDNTSWDVSNTGGSRGDSQPQWYTERENITQVVFDASFADARPICCNYWLNGFKNLTSITGIEYLNTSEVTNMHFMFWGCENLQSLDVSHFNTSKVDDMTGMFIDCKKLQSLDVSGFNTSEVLYMSQMFFGCENLQSLDVSHFNTEKISSMINLFWGCENLQSLDVSNFDTGNVTKMTGMFSGCRNLTSLDVSHFNTSEVTDMEEMFADCENLQSLDVSNFDTGNVTTMHGMFSCCLQLACLKIGGEFTVSGQTNTVNMFQDCSALENGTLIVTGTTAPSIDASQTTLFSVFENGTLIANIPQDALGVVGDGPYTWNGGTFSLFGPGTAYASLSDGTLTFQYGVHPELGSNEWDVSNTIVQPWSSERGNITQVVFDPFFANARPKSCLSWFDECQNLTSIEDIEYLNTSEVTTMLCMFKNCYNLQSLDVSHFDTGNVTSMIQMFNGCNNVPSLDVSHFNTGNVTNMSGMFENCNGLTGLDLSHFNTGKVENMSWMFYGCSGLTSLDLISFYTSNVTSMHEMFNGCKKLERLSISKGFNVGSGTNTTNLFENNDALAEGQLVVMGTAAPTIDQDIFGVFTNGTLITNLDLGTTQSGDHYTWKGGTFKSVGGVAVDYLDENGEKQTATNALPITAGCSELPGGWYYVGDDVFMNHQLTFTGDAHLILCDGKELTIKCNGERGIFVYDGSHTHDFYIYGQGGKPAMSIPEGKLSIFNNPISSGESGICVNNLIITSGIIHVFLTEKWHCHAIYAFANINIFGGSVTAKGSGYGPGLSADNSIEISGGQHNFAGGSIGRGIQSWYDDITLGWTKASDYIYATSYGTGSSGTLSIADGQSFACGEQTFSGNNVDQDQIENKTLIPASSFAGGTAGAKYVALTSDNGDWKITDPDTKVYVPTGRIVKNGEAYEMELQEVDERGKGIPSGVPVILYKETGLPANVSVVGAQGEEIDKIEYYYGEAIKDYNQEANPTPAFFATDGTKTLNELIQGALGADVDPNDYIAFTLVNDKLVAAPNSGNPVAAGKCVFVVSKLVMLQMMHGTYNPPAASARSRVISFAIQGESTGIKTVNAERSDSWYDLQGRRVNVPTKGVYFNNGKKIVIR